MQKDRPLSVYEGDGLAPFAVLGMVAVRSLFKGPLSNLALLLKATRS